MRTEQKLRLLKKFHHIFSRCRGELFLKQKGEIRFLRSPVSLVGKAGNARELDVCISNINDENQGVSSLSLVCITKTGKNKTGKIRQNKSQTVCPALRIRIKASLS